MSKRSEVSRPLKRGEFVLVFISREAEKGWRDCLSGARNAVVDCWECLTTAPDIESERLYRLKADYATGSYDGVTYDRYQYKITNGGRIWYFIERTPQDKRHAGRVLLERCMPGHPKETEGRH